MKHYQLFLSDIQLAIAKTDLKPIAASVGRDFSDVRCFFGLRAYQDYERTLKTLRRSSSSVPALIYKIYCVEDCEERSLIVYSDKTYTFKQECYKVFHR